MADPKQNGCSKKHAILASGISAGLLTVCIVVTLAITSARLEPVSAIEPRVRIIEQETAKAQAKFDSIQESLRRIERKLDAQESRERVNP